MLIQNFNLYNAEWLDLVFDNRNKNYGAYELRSHYAGTMMRSIAITVFGVAAVVTTLTIITKRPQLQALPTEHTTVVDLTKIMQAPPVKPIKHIAQTHAAPLSHPKTVVIPTHVTADPVRSEPPTLTEIQHATIGTDVQKGTDAGVNAPVTPAGTGNGNGVTESTVNTNEVYTFADVSPEPNGGMAGWSKFLQSHIHYPDTEVQGRVLISFVVERDGSLTDIKVVRSVDSQLDAEALRVLKIAPKWKPGLQGGKPVRVQYTIPINFQLNN